MKYNILFFMLISVTSGICLAAASSSTSSSDATKVGSRLARKMITLSLQYGGFANVPSEKREEACQEVAEQRLMEAAEEARQEVIERGLMEAADPYLLLFPRELLQPLDVNMPFSPQVGKENPTDELELWAISIDFMKSAGWSREQFKETEAEYNSITDSTTRIRWLSKLFKTLVEIANKQQAQFKA